MGGAVLAFMAVLMTVEAQDASQSFLAAEFRVAFFMTVSAPCRHFGEGGVAVFTRRPGDVMLERGIGGRFVLLDNGVARAHKPAHRCFVMESKILQSTKFGESTGETCYNISLGEDGDVCKLQMDDLAFTFDSFAG